MEDGRIVELYWQRDESAIAETQKKYGRYCRSIAENILHSAEDAEECENDTYIGAWSSMPPHRPAMLSTFLGKICRRAALKRLRSMSAEKRGGLDSLLALDELEDCIPAGQSIDDALEAKELAKTIDSFLDALPTDERRVFVCRYFYLDSVDSIASRFGFGRSKVKMMLKRTRDRLSQRLQKEGIFI